MATLFNNKISETYEGLIKTSDSAIIGLIEKNLTDGLGNASTLSIGTLTASFTGTLDLTNATVVGLPSGGNVDSVNGQTGVVVLTTTNIAEGTNLYFTDARVEANSAVALNTAKVGITTSQANAIVANTSKVSFPEAPNDGQQYARQSQAWAVVSGGGAVDSVNGLTGVVVLDTDNISEGTTNLYFTDARVNANSNVAANTAKVGITTTQANEIAANTLKVGITTQQATDITNNNAKISFDSASSTKLNGIETGAQVNTVDSVNSLTGAVSLGLLELDDVGADGTNGQVLTTNGSGSFSFTTVSGGGAVNSVNGQTGTVVLDTDDINEGTSNLYYTEARVSANSSVAANTAKVGITTQQASDITANNAKVGITTQQATDITTNNAKVGITTQQASDITTNNAKVGITTTQASEIAANTLKNSYPTADATKLAGIQAGAEVNDVDSVNGATGVVSLGLLDLDDVGSDGISGQVLTTDGSGSFTFTTVSSGGGGVTSVTGTGTVSGLTLTTGGTSAAPILTLGGTLSLTSANVTDGLGFTPYNSTNPSNFTSNLGIVQSVTGNAGNLEIVSGVLNVPPAAAAPVDSVNGATGVVVLDTDDIAEGTTNKYMVLGTSAGTALAGNTSLLQLGSTSTTALAGDTTTITPTQAANITTNNSKVSMVLGTTAGTALEGDTTTITTAQANEITANTAKVSFVDAPSDGNEYARKNAAWVVVTDADSVTSVNTQTGAVVLDTDDIAQGSTNKYMVLGTTSTTALAGNTTTISSTQATDITNNNAKNSYPSADATKLAGIAAGAEVNVQSNWNETDTNSDAFIQNKPTIPSAAPVDSVNGDTGVVVLDTDDIGEGTTNLYYTEARVSSNSSVAANTAKVGITTQQASDITANNAKNSYPSADATKLAGIEAGAEVNTVDSVNGSTGAVTLTTSDIAEGTNKYMVLGTSSTTALAGDTALLQLGTTSTTALAGDTTTISAQQATDISNNNNKISFDSTSSTKLASIENGAEVNTIDSSTSGEISGSDQILNIVSLTQSEYDAGSPSATTLYIIT